jgi:flavin reductase (DIM6/NTAB) family NADH-FMN oxidoreductase RutF
MTANGVTSVSLSPPLALACVGHERNTYTLIRSNKRFGISVLSAGQEAVAAHFALPPEKRNPASQFEFVHLNSVPVLKGALAAMDCRVVAAHEAGDHTIFIAEVERTEVTDGDPLLWFGGEFASLAGRSGAADGHKPQGRRRGD